MRKGVLIILLLLMQDVMSQNSDLLIARNNGIKTLEDGTTIRVFGYATKLSENPDLPGPTLTYYEGDSVTIDMWNVSQGAPHTIHLHGLDVNQENDGVPHLSFEVEHMQHGFYRFKAPHPGTYLYHCHVVSAIHVQAGMYGMLIVKPKGDENLTWKGGYNYSREYNFLLSEVDTNWHTDKYLDHPLGNVNIKVPSYYPSYFLINGKSGSQLKDEAMTFQKDDNTYLRLGNIGFYANRYYFPRHLHARIVSSDGRKLPSSFESDTLDIFPGERYGVLINPDDYFTDSILVDYLDLNTLVIQGTEHLNYTVTKDLSVNKVANTEISIYPNPTKSSIMIKLEPSEVYSQVKIYDILGATVHESALSSGVNQIEFNLAPGAYIVEVSDINKRSHQRIIIR